MSIYRKWGLHVDQESEMVQMDNEHVKKMLSHTRISIILDILVLTGCSVQLKTEKIMVNASDELNFYYG